MTKQTYYCDACGIEKKESNHWLAVQENSDTTMPNMVVMGFRDSSRGDKHLCGVSCLLKVVTAFEETLRRKAEDSSDMTRWGM